MKEDKKEKPTPVHCLCGKRAVIVKNKAKKMISCPDPENCCGNFRTMWHGHEESAIAEWDNLIAAAKNRGGIDNAG